MGVALLFRVTECGEERHRRPKVDDDAANAQAVPAPEDADSKELHITRTMVQSSLKLKAQFEAKQRAERKGDDDDKGKGKDRGKSKEKTKQNATDKKLAKYGHNGGPRPLANEQMKRSSKKKSNKSLKYKPLYDEKDRVLMEKLHGIKRKPKEN